MKRIVTLILAACLCMSGCGRADLHGSSSDLPAGGTAVPGNEGNQGPAAVPAAAALAVPSYPVLPDYPQEPAGDDWDKYSGEIDAYYSAIQELLGDGIAESTLSALDQFAAKSTAAVLEGQEGRNVIFSPVSLWSALAMAARCADGESRSQVLDLLGVPGVDTLSEQVSQVWRQMYAGNQGASLLMANSIWLNNRAEAAYVQETLDDLKDSFYAGAYSVAMGEPGADQAATQWISDNTGGLIGSDGQPVVKTSVDTLAMLISTLYYKAGWTDKFSEELTQKDTFTDATGAETEVDFMHRTQHGSFMLGEHSKAAALSTQLGEMVFILPDEGVTPESLQQTPGFLSGLDLHSPDAHHGDVQWSVPKFDLDTQLELLDALREMGVSDLLDPAKADLSALSTLEAYISEAKQLARVKVDEEGVEAAAATIIMESTTALQMEEPEVCVMDLDRPFLFAIRYAGVPLFVGIVNQM